MCDSHDKHAVITVCTRPMLLYRHNFQISFFLMYQLGFNHLQLKARLTFQILSLHLFTRIRVFIVDGEYYCL